MRALLIEPDHNTAYAIEQYLGTCGFTVYTTDEADEGVDLARQYEYDVAVVAACSKTGRGAATVRAMRRKNLNLPVVVYGDLDRGEEIQLLEVGCDDFLQTPLQVDVLGARVRAVTRRHRGFATPEIRVGALTLDLSVRVVRNGAGTIHLTAKEFAILEVLTLRRGKCVSKEALLDHLYGGMDEPNMKIIDVFVCKLRHKIRNCARVETIWGRGYMIPQESVS